MTNDAARLARVSLCLATSLDGKIAEAPGRPPRFSSQRDLEKLFRLRAAADGLLIGANTVRQEELPALVRNGDLRRQRVAAGKPPHPASIIVSASLDLPWDSPYFTRKQQQIYIMTAAPAEAARAKMAALDLHCLDTGSVLSLRNGLQQLRRKGIETVLAEGGGRLTHGLLREGVVDRLYLTIAPFIFAGEDTPVLCKGPRLTPPARFELCHGEQVGDEWHLEYHIRDREGQDLQA